MAQQVTFEAFIAEFVNRLALQQTYNLLNADSQKLTNFIELMENRNLVAVVMLQFDEIKHLILSGSSVSKKHAPTTDEIILGLISKKYVHVPEMEIKSKTKDSPGICVTDLHNTVVNMWSPEFGEKPGKQKVKKVLLNAYVGQNEEYQKSVERYNRFKFQPL
jgi:hypothetical protein